MSIQTPTEPIRVPSPARHRADTAAISVVRARTEREQRIRALVASLRAEGLDYPYRDDLDEIPEPPALPIAALHRADAPTVPPLSTASGTRMQSLGRWARGLIDPLSRPLPALGTQEEA